MNTIIIDEKWYAIGAGELVGSLPDEQLVLMIGATLMPIEAGTYNDKGAWRFPITPIDAPVWAKLGKEAMAFVPEDRQGDILNFGISPDNCVRAEYVDATGVCGGTISVPFFPVVWLSLDEMKGQG